MNVNGYAVAYSSGNTEGYLTSADISSSAWITLGNSDAKSVLTNEIYNEGDDSRVSGTYGIALASPGVGIDITLEGYGSTGKYEVTFSTYLGSEAKAEAAATVTAPDFKRFANN
jgi:hypothetical protein